MSERRYGVFYIAAPRGDKRAARSLILASIRDVLGAKASRPPYNLDYTSERDARSYGAYDAKYTIEVTDGEFAAIMRRIIVRARAGGWSQPPVDQYHD